MKNFKITEHFNYKELVFTKHRVFKQENYMLGKQYIPMLRLVCNYILEPIRTRYGLPIYITSGFRSRALNEFIKGSENSQHLKAEVPDFYITNYDLKKVFDWISLNIKFGQLIYYVEKNFIHCSLPTLENNGQILIFENGNYRKIT